MSARTPSPARISVLSEASMPCTNSRRRRRPKCGRAAGSCRRTGTSRRRRGRPRRSGSRSHQIGAASALAAAARSRDSETSSAETLRRPASGKRVGDALLERFGRFDDQPRIERPVVRDRGCRDERSPSQVSPAGALARSPYWFGPGLPGMTQSAMKAMIEITGMNSTAAMMPGRPMSCSRLTLSATFDHSEAGPRDQKTNCPGLAGALPSGTSVN